MSGLLLTLAVTFACPVTESGAPCVATSFVYGLQPAIPAQRGYLHPPLYYTTVSGPRPGQQTTYRLDPYGASSQVERTIAPGRVAISSTIWDTTHLKPKQEIDPLGRVTDITLDERGNAVVRTTSTLRLASGAGLTSAEQVVDSEGAPVAAVAETRSFDAETNGESCHLDAEGRLTTTAYVAGLPTLRHVYATPVQVAAGTAGCAELAATASTSPDDRVTQFGYCQLGSACPLGAVRGDLVASTEGATTWSEARSVAVDAYDALGNATSTRARVSGTGSITTTSSYDNRSLLRTQADSTGHSAFRTYDGLDRPVVIQRVDGTGKSPGEYRSFEYYAGGQPRVEKLGTASAPASILSRSFELDGLNRPKTITESGPGLAATIATRLEYDEAGNKAATVDRRGVRTETSYDLADRAIASMVLVTPGDQQTFVAGQGDLAGGAPGARRTVASWSWDDAGNKLSETDLHGHKTEFELDALYRVVRVKHPAVAGAGPGASAVAYVTERRYDRVGNKVRETDGNGHTTVWGYDAANRVIATTDAVGRQQTQTFDAQGNLVSEKTLAGGVERFSRTSWYDGVGRQTRLAETIAGAASVEARTLYDDAAHVVYAQDRRGYVTARKLDGLDRVYEETVDATGTALGEPAGAGLATATTKLEYDAGGRRAAVVDGEGRRTEEDWDALGRVTARRLPMAVAESFKYDGEGHAIWTKDRRGIERAATYDLLGRPTGENLSPSLVPNGVSQASADIVPVRYEYGDQSASGATWVATLRGETRKKTTRVQDALHREVEVHEPDGAFPAANPRRTFWDAANKRLTVDRRGYQARFEYDAANRLVSATEDASAASPIQPRTVVYRDGQGEEEATDRSGIPTVTTRDGAGRTTLVVRGAAGGPQTTDKATYDGNGNVVTKTDANGHATSVSYDGANRVLTETRAYGTPVAATTRYTWDKVGNRLTAKGPRGTWAFDEKTTYDDLNRPVRTEDALGHVATRAFDAAGNKLCEKRPLGGDPLSMLAGRTVAELESTVCAGEQLTRFAYDAESKLTSVMDAQQGEHSFVYDEVRNLVAKQDANGSLTTYAYDLLDRRTDEWQHLDAHPRLRARGEVPNGATEGAPSPTDGTGSLHWHVAFDASGNPTHATDPRNFETVRTYGSLNRLETETYQELVFNPQYPWLLGVKYEYTGNGALAKRTETKRTGPGATVAEVHDPEYDGLERLTSETRYDGKVVAYAYDLKGNRTKVTDPDLVETSYTFDAQDRLATATTPEGKTTYQYLPDGLLQKTTMPNTVAEGRCYDAAGHLTTIVTGKGSVDETACTAASLVSRFEYAFDANGNRLSQAERRTAPGGTAAGPAETTTYGYDPLDRLVGVKYPDTTATLYRLDPVGNRLGERKTKPGIVTALTVAAFAALAQPALASDLTNAFNRADWLTSQSDAVDTSRNATLGYDLSGNLTQKTKATGTRLFAWDARGALASVSESGTELGRYDYDASGLRVKRKAASETVEYVLDDGHVLQEADGATSGHPSYRRYHYGYGPLSVVDNTGKRFIQTDALGSPTDLTSTSGAIASMRKYDAWGSYRDATAPISADEKLGYTGHQYDPETGLVYARARYYDPEIGAFISRDSYEGTLFEAPSLHRYMYAQGNPLAFVDPNGNESVREALNRKASESAQANEEGWMTAFNAAHAAWDFVDAFSFGTMAKLDTIEDRVTAGDPRYGGGAGAAYKGALGEANYIEDVLGTASVGVLKVAVAGKVLEALEPANGLMAPATTGGGRIAQSVGTGALSMGAANFAGQGAENYLGQRTGYDAKAFATDTLAGGLAGALGAAVAEASRAIAPTVQRTLAAARDELRALKPVATVVAKLQETVQSARNVVSEAWRDARTPWTGPKPVPAGTPYVEPAGAGWRVTPEPMVFRQGTFADLSVGWEGNYLKGRQWAIRNPLSTPDFARGYGLPAENTGQPDWVARGRVRGAHRMRPAPASHNHPANTGGETEVLPAEPESVFLDWFHMP